MCVNQHIFKGVAWKILALLLLIFSPLFAFSHGDLHLRIQEVSKQIEASPDSSYLYLKRGILYFQHEDFPESLKDLKQCEEMKYSDRLLDLTFAKVYQKLNQYDNSIIFINKILELDPQHVNAWKLKGQVLFEMGQFEDSANAFLVVIKKAIRCFPNNYLDVANSYEMMNTEASKREAISIIEKGIEDLGPLITFYDRLVELGLKYEDFELAINYQNAIIGLSQRKESAIYKRGMIFIEMGEIVEARKDFELAKEEFEILSQRLRSTKAMKELKSKIDFQLKNL